MEGDEFLIIDLTTSPLPAETPQPCPICGISLPVAELAAHANAHFTAENELETGSPLFSEGLPVPCPLCGQMLSPDEIDSHALAHAIQLEDLDPHTIADDLYYEELRAVYGFTARHRATGKCFICGASGHWVPECPQNPDNISAQARIIPQPTAAVVSVAQLPDPQWHRPPFDPAAMMRLLGQCSTKQNLPREFSKCTTLLCGTVVHFGGQRIDSGWGCGYRNIQMMAAHILATNDLSAECLFAGCRFVPDIPSLQAWIEVAWAAGFDSVGAGQLEGSLQGSKKWIGTTEAAALFRYFGIPAIIIDFGSNKKDAYVNRTGGHINNDSGIRVHGHQMRITAYTSATAPTARSTDTATGAVPTLDLGSIDPRSSDSPSFSNDNASAEAGEVHEGVECDVCGSFPIQGERFKSQVLPNYDVCSLCLKNNSEINAAAGPFSRIPVLSSAEALGMEAGSSQEVLLRRQKRAKETPQVKANSTAQLAAPTTVGGASGLSRSDTSYHNGRLKECSPAAKSMLQWVWNYFSETDGAATAEAATELNISRGGPGWKVETRYTCRCPLYLQHEGHSRTIMGVEKKERRDGTSEITLLILDPGVPPPALQDALTAGIKWQRLIKRTDCTFNKLQYQMLYCPNGAVPAKPGSQQYEALKVLAAQESH